MWIRPETFWLQNAQRQPCRGFVLLCLLFSQRDTEKFLEYTVNKYNLTSKEVAAGLPPLHVLSY